MTGLQVRQRRRVLGIWLCSMLSFACSVTVRIATTGRPPAPWVRATSWLALGFAAVACALWLHDLRQLRKGGRP